MVFGRSTKGIATRNYQRIAILIKIHVGTLQLFLQGHRQLRQRPGPILLRAQIQNLQELVVLTRWEGIERLARMDTLWPTANQQQFSVALPVGKGMQAAEACNGICLEHHFKRKVVGLGMGI